MYVIDNNGRVICMNKFIVTTAASPVYSTLVGILFNIYNTDSATTILLVMNYKFLYNNL